MWNSRAAGLTLCVALTVACGDQATDVRQRGPIFTPPMAAVVADPASETITLDQVDSAYGRASGWSSQLTSPYIRIMRVEGSSSIAITKRYPEAANPQPNPLEARHGLGVVVAWPNGSTVYNFPNVAGDARMYVKLTSGQIIWKATHGGGTQPNQSGSRTNGTPWWCGPAYNDFCYRYSGGGGSVKITPLQGEMHILADSTAVASGSSVKFTLTADTVEGWALPIEVDSVKWIPAAADSGGELSEAANTNACFFSGAPLQCSRKVLGSGKLRVIAHVGGFRKQVDQPITVTSPRIILVASKSTIKVKGDTVAFTASWSDGSEMKVDQWRFIPDSGADATYGCPAYMNPCKRPVQQSGSMEVKAYKGNNPRTARAHVTLIPCPAQEGSSFLDNMQVRHRLYEIMQASHPEKTPDQFVDSTNWQFVTEGRHESGALFIRHPDGTFDEIAPKVKSQNGCHWVIDRQQVDSLKNSLTPGDTLVIVHSHPHDPGDAVFGGCPVSGAGGSGIAWRWPGDLRPGIIPAWQDPFFTGPSPGDWLDTSTEQYVIDHDLGDSTQGYIYKIPQGAVSSGMPAADAIGNSTRWTAACGYK